MADNLVIIMLMSLMTMVNFVLILLVVRMFGYLNLRSQYYSELMSALTPLFFIGIMMDLLSFFGIIFFPLPRFDDLLVYFPFFLLGTTLSLFFISSRYSRENLLYPATSFLVAGIIVTGMFLTHMYEYATHDSLFIGVFFLLEGLSSILVFLLVFVTMEQGKAIIPFFGGISSQGRKKPLYVQLILLFLVSFQVTVGIFSLFYVLTSIIQA